MVLFSKHSLPHLASSEYSANSSHLVGSKFVRPTAFSAGVCSVMNFVSHVLLLGAPLKVVKIIIRAVIVWKVTGLHSFWAWTNKHFKNDSMHETPAARKVDPQVSVAVMVLLQFPPLVRQMPSAYPAFATRPYRAIASYAIPRLAWNSTIFHRRISDRHGGPPLKVRGVQGRPNTYNERSARSILGSKSRGHGKPMRVGA